MQHFFPWCIFCLCYFSSLRQTVLCDRFQFDDMQKIICKIYHYCAILEWQKFKTTFVPKIITHFRQVFYVDKKKKKFYETSQRYFLQSVSALYKVYLLCRQIVTCILITQIKCQMSWTQLSALQIFIYKLTISCHRQSYLTQMQTCTQQPSCVKSAHSLSDISHWQLSRAGREWKSTSDNHFISNNKRI